MVNPLGHWIRFLFCTSSRIPLRGLSGSWGIVFQIPLMGLSGFRVPLGLVVLAHPLPVPVHRSVGFLYIYICFDISGSHCSMVPYWVVFCDIVCQVFLSLFPEYTEMVVSDSISDPIKSHVYCSIYFFVYYTVCRSIVRCYWFGWL